MATLPDHEIRLLCRNRGLVEPFDPDYINPASIDVTLGATIKVENQSGGFDDIPLRGEEEPFLMRPGQFILAHTAELVRVPNEIECVFQLKSSRGREGYEHSLAGYIDPGFTGRVTLELSNVRQYADLPLWAGMRIGQLRFSYLNSMPMRSYAVTGRYNNADTVEESKG